MKRSWSGYARVPVEVFEPAGASEPSMLEGLHVPASGNASDPPRRRSGEVDVKAAPGSLLFLSSGSETDGCMGGCLARFQTS